MIYRGDEVGGVALNYRHESQSARIQTAPPTFDPLLQTRKHNIDFTTTASNATEHLTNAPSVLRSGHTLTAS